MTQAVLDIRLVLWLTQLVQGYRHWWLGCGLREVYPDLIYLILLVYYDTPRREHATWELKHNAKFLVAIRIQTQCFYKKFSSIPLCKVSAGCEKCERASLLPQTLS
jgi:hypothetical protein